MLWLAKEQRNASSAALRLRQHGICGALGARRWARLKPRLVRDKNPAASAGDNGKYVLHSLYDSTAAHANAENAVGVTAAACQARQPMLTRDLREKALGGQLLHAVQRAHASH